jgi:hypothetical protein
MSTVMGSVRAEVKREASAALARESVQPDFVMLPIARKWGERRRVSHTFIGFAYVVTGVSVFLVTALFR